MHLKSKQQTPKLKWHKSPWRISERRAVKNSLPFSPLKMNLHLSWTAQEVGSAGEKLNDWLLLPFWLAPPLNVQNVFDPDILNESDLLHSSNILGQLQKEKSFFSPNNIYINIRTEE